MTVISIGAIASESLYLVAYFAALLSSVGMTKAPLLRFLMVLLETGMLPLLLAEPLSPEPLRSSCSCTDSSWWYATASGSTVRAQVEQKRAGVVDPLRSSCTWPPSIAKSGSVQLSEPPRGQEGQHARTVSNASAGLSLMMRAAMVFLLEVDMFS